MTDLYHYTCTHSATQIRADGKVIPQPSISTDRHRCSWWTDLDTHDRDTLRDTLGLTSLILDCDRTEHRFKAAKTIGILPWAAARRYFDPWTATAWEKAPGVDPTRWWVAFKPVPIEEKP